MSITEPTITNFAGVKQAELQSINKNQDVPLIGLALSGGGIRSATFCLGVLQALARHQKLRQFDYLSSVSGGGYIGSWLSTLTLRQAGGNIIKTEELLSNLGGEEVSAVKFLRDYSNFLTPKKSVLSNDSVSAVTTYLRNLFLNQTLLFLTLATLLLIPPFVKKTGDFIEHGLPSLWVHGATFVLLVFAVVMIAQNLTLTNREYDSVSHEVCATSLGVTALIATPLILASWLFSLQFDAFIALDWAGLGLMFGALYLVLWLTALLRYSGLSGAQNFIINYSKREFFGVILWTFTAGFLGGALLWIVLKTLSNYPIGITVWPWLSTVIGMPLVLGVFFIIVIYHIGMMGRLFSEFQREWWSRLGAILGKVSLVWLGLFGIAIFGPASLLWLATKYTGWFATGGASWLVLTGASLLVGKSAATPAVDSATEHKLTDTGLDLITQVAPYAFIFGALGLISALVHKFLFLIEESSFNPPEYSEMGHVLSLNLDALNLIDLPALLTVVIALLGITLILAFRVNVNVFSLGQFYRSRLVRAYLGATRKERKPNPFTGLDPDDDLELSKLADQRPYHLINTAINFTSGGRLAWQDRKAASFLLSPKFCGYKLPDRDVFRASKEYAAGHKRDEGFKLGKAMAISGAAASPNSGYHTAPGMAFLLTFLNVRLGSWVGNPANNKTWRDADPGLGLRYLISELLGFSNLDSSYVYLSDGGHFDNTGIYELVRRQCQLIVLCDAGKDTAYNYEDLANVIRKCYIDFDVTISPDSTLPSKNLAIDSVPYANFKINYPNGHKGDLLLLKPCLLPNLPADLTHYASTNPQFPQQSTNDQWFDEAQFESYRKLGFLVAEAAIANQKL